MKNNPNSESGIFNPRIFAGFILSCVGMFLALVSLARTETNAVAAAASSSGATIYVTTTAQKIGGIGTGGCSLQEAIYSAVLHDSLDGGAHGIAIDRTSPDHFITTECVMGTGNGDIIVLPTDGVFNLGGSANTFVDGDAYNPYGPTATPIIFSNIAIEGHGATLQWTGSRNVRLFAVGPATINTPNGIVSGTGNLTLKNVYIKGFHVKGGNGGGGGGGGLGAGGAIYLQYGNLTVENSTFENNGAIGGNGAAGDLGGGGGIWGNGGNGGADDLTQFFGGGGGGGSKGNGGDALAPHFYPGGGGGTVFSGGNGTDTNHGGSGGYLCGGSGGENGQAGKCRGGGGGGGRLYTCGGLSQYCNGDGGNGAYGGGGGGAPGNGGRGGFGGGGGPGGGNGGNGGFGGGGGGGGSLGNGGPFGGKAGPFVAYQGFAGGGGGALGGAIFNHGGSVTVRNGTFYNNYVTRGVSTGSGSNGSDAGGAIFSLNGSLTLINVTVSGNQSTGSGGGVVAYHQGLTTASFTLYNSIIANNGANECFVNGDVTTKGAGNIILNNGDGSGTTLPFYPCPGVVLAPADPNLGPLQDNGGPTPTMAIPLYSSAMGVADPATSLPYDQRYADRPQPDNGGRNGYDIGAYEVCRRFFGATLQAWVCSETNAPPPPPQTTLTMQASPSYEGTTDPAPGTHSVDLNSVIAVQAIANSGYHFTNWTGNVAEPSNPLTTITMTQAETVTANFATGAPSADLYVTVTDGKSAAVAGAKNTYTIVVGNAGPSYMSGAVVKDTFPSIFTGVTYNATEAGGAFGFTVSGSGNISDTVTLPPGSSITYKATGKLSAAGTGTVSDKATVTVPSGITDPNTGNNTATDTDTIILKADLKVTVTDGKTSAVPGSKNTYTIVVTNAGPSKVTGAVIRDTFPSTFTGVTYTGTQSGGASGFSASGSGNINNTVSMPPASKITYKATGTISASATQSISDTATVTAPSGVTDPNTANNSATDTDTL
jgi:uncharacterized repeat protein (TIGR01451 family)